jgi:radical SAM superfamily enzyme YgiQ (UPF0313 family)
MKRVLLVSANMIKMPYPVYPVGLDFVAGSLTSRYETKVADMNELNSLTRLGELVRNFAPDYIGFAIRNIDNLDTISSRSYLDDYRDLIAEIRRNSSAPLILGGSGFTIFPCEFIKALDADYGIAGEGERLLLLLEALDKNADVSSIDGILTRASNSVTYRAWEGAINGKFDSGSSHAGYYLSYGGMLNLQTKRGCPFRCSYCTYPYIEGSKMRFFAPREIAQKARILQDAGAKYIFITDSAFNASHDHSLLVAEAFMEARISIPWGGFFAPTIAPADYYQRLADAGLTHVEFGTEAINDKMLASLQKPFTAGDVFIAHRQALDAGLFIAHYFLLGGPGESEVTLEDTLSGIDNLEQAVFFFFCGIRIYPHTSLYDRAVREGQITATEDLLQPVFYRSKSISCEEIINKVENYAAGRLNWLIGAAESKTTRILPRLYERGFSGPLWERLI